MRLLLSLRPRRPISWPHPRPPWKRRVIARQLLREHPERVATVVRTVIEILAQGPVSSLRKLRDAVRRKLGGCSDGDVDAAVELLGRGVHRTIGARGATQHALNALALPSELRLLVQEG